MTEENNEPPIIEIPITQAIVSRIVAEAIEEERLVRESAIIEQEHRITNILLNLYYHARSKQEALRSAAWRAIIWKLFTPSAAMTVAIGGGLTAALGLIVALRANVLLEDQNRKIDVQNMLIESQRRSSLIFELSSILDALGKEQKISVGEDRREVIKPNSALIGRISSLSRSLKPYRPLNIEKYDEIIDKTNAASIGDSIISYFSPYPERNFNVELGRYISPERGQLLVALMDAGVELVFITTGSSADFTYADLKGVQINSNLNYIDLSHSDLSESKIGNIEIMGAVLEGATLAGAVIHGAKILNLVSDKLILDKVEIGYTVFETVINGCRSANDIEIYEVNIDKIERFPIDCKEPITKFYSRINTKHPSIANSVEIDLARKFGVQSPAGIVHVCGNKDVENGVIFFKGRTVCECGIEFKSEASCTNPNTNSLSLDEFEQSWRAAAR